jgi:hypothetical protein
MKFLDRQRSKKKMHRPFPAGIEAESTPVAGTIEVDEKGAYVLRGVDGKMYALLLSDRNRVIAFRWVEIVSVTPHPGP